MRPDTTARPLQTEATKAPDLEGMRAALESALSGWKVTLDHARTSSGVVTRWVAAQEGHHEQTALDPSELFRRVESYEARRQIGS